MRRLIVVATVLATLLAGGCGIPDDTDVTVDGPGQSSGTSVGDDGVPPVQDTREATQDPELFVRNYLKAAAGDPETAAARVKEFLDPKLAAKFPGGTGVQVVRLLADPGINPGNPEIELKVRQLGTLNADGMFAPAPTAAEPVYKLKVQSLEGRSGLFVTAAPQVMLMTDTALDDFYQMRTIYFWNKANTSLVPDQRYMPSSVIPVKQPTTILRWLAGGPAPWLGDAVNALPRDTDAPDNVPAISDDTLQITLSPQAVQPPGDPAGLDRLRRQLQWSLRPLEVGKLELKIGRQDSVTYTDPTREYLNSNLAYRLADRPDRFVIFNGVIRRLSDSPQAGDPVPVLKPAANRGIASAAISSSGKYDVAAVVTGSGRGQVLRVAAAPTGAQADLRTVDGLSGTLGRPIWAVTGDGGPAGAVGLVIRNSQLYSFAADGSSARPVEWPDQPGPVTSVSVAPDGRRVALVSAGRLYRAVLTTDGLALNGTELLSPPTLTRVAAVAWSSETYLAVAGMRGDGRFQVLDVSADGALFTIRLGDIGTQPVTDLVAYPANPVRIKRETGSPWVAYMAGGAAFDVLAGPDKILTSRLAGSSAGAPAAATPVAPFFLD
jgi:hypothetical protein